MKLISFIFTFSFFTLTIFSQIPAGYYDDATGTGDVLRGNLESIIDGHTSQSYTSLWTHFQTTDPDIYYENDGTVLDMYSEEPFGDDPYNYIFVTDQCGNYGGEGDCYNREHSFPGSWFNDASPMYTDMYHLYPTDGYVNGIRSNYPFGETVSPSYTSSNGSKRGVCSYPGYTGIIFEPIDEFKGDFARSYFYMATRYYSLFSGFSSPMLSGDNYTEWAKAMLLDWHDSDPVSQKEIDRNEAVYLIQGNRNPYIDHPEWGCIVFGSDCPGYVEDPSDLVATAVSDTQIDLTWLLNADNDDVLLAFNTVNSFGEPTGSYTAGQIISGGGEVLYVGNSNSYNHSGLILQTYFYKLWSLNTSEEYSEGIETNAIPLFPEPSNNVTNFIVNNETSNSISLSWTDAIGDQLPEAYLIKASTGSIIPPVDGTPEVDGQFVKNINYGIEAVTFSGLSPSTTYFFEIFPYTNPGSYINYKTDSPVTTIGITLADIPIKIVEQEIVFDVFPNPVEDILIVDFSDFKGGYSVELISISGVCLFKSVSNSSRIQINLENYPGGMYIILVRTEKDLLRKRIIIK